MKQRDSFGAQAGRKQFVDWRIRKATPRGLKIDVGTSLQQEFKERKNWVVADNSILKRAAIHVHQIGIDSSIEKQFSALDAVVAACLMKRSEDGLLSSLCMASIYGKKQLF